MVKMGDGRSQRQPSLAPAAPSSRVAWTPISAARRRRLISTRRLSWQAPAAFCSSWPRARSSRPSSRRSSTRTRTPWCRAAGRFPITRRAHGAVRHHELPARRPAPKACLDQPDRGGVQNVTTAGATRIPLPCTPGFMCRVPPEESSAVMAAVARNLVRKRPPPPQTFAASFLGSCARVRLPPFREACAGCAAAGFAHALARGILTWGTVPRLKCRSSPPGPAAGRRLYPGTLPQARNSGARRNACGARRRASPF